MYPTIEKIHIIIKGKKQEVFIIVSTKKPKNKCVIEEVIQLSKEPIDDGITRASFDKISNPL